MSLISEHEKLKSLKAELATIRRRISVTKQTIDDKKHLTSTVLMGLQKREMELVQLIAEFPSPPDFTPNPSGSTPTPAAALAYA